jgi:predicted GNAT family N-acyltransferase
MQDCEYTDVASDADLLPSVWHIHSNQVEEEIVTCKHLHTQTTQNDIFNLIVLFVAGKAIARENVLIYVQTVLDWWLGGGSVLLHM